MDYLSLFLWDVVHGEKNSIDDNLNYKHFINITRISTEISGRESTLKDFFEKYCHKHHPKSLDLLD